MERNSLQIQTTVKVDGSDNVSWKEERHVQYSGEPEETARVYSLQRWHNATPRSIGSRGRSRSRGRHPVAIDGIRSGLLAVHISVCTLGAHRHVSILIGRRSQVTGATGEGKRGRRREGPGLLRVGGMGCEGIHRDVSQRYSSCRPAKTEEIEKALREGSLCTKDREISQSQ